MSTRLTVSDRFSDPAIRRSLMLMGALLLALFTATAAYAHGVAEGDQGFIEQNSGPQVFAFL